MIPEVWRLPFDLSPSNRYKRSLRVFMTLDSLTQLIQFIFGLGILIILHELGHFVVARLLHVEVEEFGIGFPPEWSNYLRPAAQSTL